MAVSVYKYPQVKHLTLGSIQPNCERTFMIVSSHYTNSRITLFRNTDQRVDFLFKDWDRRPIKFEETEHLWFKAFDRDREIFTKELELFDFDRGRYTLDLTDSETGSFRVSDEYSWCVVVKDTALDTTRMLFTNQDYGAQAPLRVAEGPLPIQKPAQIINPQTFSGIETLFTSSALVGAAQVNNPMGVHSFVFNMTNYSGTLTVQAATDPDIPVDNAGWVAVHTETFAAETGAVHLALTGNYTWLRLRFTSVTNLGDISYRNTFVS